MKNLIVAICLFSLVGLMAAQIAPGMLENIDVDSMLKNSKYVRTQINCVLHKGKCDKTGRDLKSLLPEVLQRNCAACSRTQDTNSKKIVKFMKDKHHSDWVVIESMYGHH